MEVSLGLSSPSEIICEDLEPKKSFFEIFIQKKSYLYGLTNKYHNKKLERRQNTWFLRLDEPLPESIYFFRFHVGDNIYPSSNYPTVNFGKPVNILVVGNWNQTDPKQLQSLVNVWMKLNDEDCYDDLFVCYYSFILI